MESRATSGEREGAHQDLSPEQKSAQRLFEIPQCEVSKHDCIEPLASGRSSIHDNGTLIGTFFFFFGVLQCLFTTVQLTPVSDNKIIGQGTGACKNVTLNLFILFVQEFHDNEVHNNQFK